MNDEQPGCDVPEIEECVCGYEPTCCEIGWHELCTQFTQDICRDDCSRTLTYLLASKLDDFVVTEHGM